MDNDKTESKLRSLIGELTQQNISGIGLDEDLLASLGLDSLSGLKMLALIEKKFQVRFPNEELSALKTLNKLTSAILKQLNNNPQQPSR